MLLLDASKPKTLSLDFEVEGLKKEDLKILLRVEIAGVEYGFPGEFTKSGKVKISIPPISEVCSGSYNMDDKYPARIDVTGSGFYLNPWSDEVSIKSSPKIEMTIKEDTGTDDGLPKAKISSIKESDLIEEEPEVEEIVKEEKIIKQKIKEEVIEEDTDDDLLSDDSLKLIEEVEGLIEKRPIKRKARPIRSENSITSKYFDELKIYALDNKSILEHNKIALKSAHRRIHQLYITSTERGNIGFSKALKKAHKLIVQEMTNKGVKHKKVLIENISKM